MNKFYFQWHITDACNLRCSHCYQENYSVKSELTLKELKEIADNIFSTLSNWNKKGDFSITGGEPLLRKDLLDFAEYLNKSSDVCNIDFLTNGTLIDDTFIERIKKLHKIKYIQISLDGATSAIHDMIRGEGSFEKALVAIRNLIKNGFEVRIMYTLQKANISDVPSMFDFALKENISGLTFERMVPIGSSTKSSESLLSTQEIKNIYQYISNRSDEEFEKGNSLRILKYRPLWVLIDPCRSNDGSIPHKELGSLCSIGLDGICILPDATVLACRRLPIPIGDLRKNSLEEIWSTSALLWEIADKRNLKGKCKTCEYISRCSGCRAMAYAVSGDYLSEDPNCWKSICQTS
ncbi:MAG TPA: radical SAM protein [Ignavibacteriaceae bacterium]|nr:radical SAM protein [Ignavibacteriaceae bacterium]